MLISRYPPHIGGAEIQCQRLSRELVRRGHSVTVLTERLPGLPAQEMQDGVSVHRFRCFGRPPWSSLQYALQAGCYLLKNRDFDILHAHMLALPALTALAIGYCARKAVIVKVAGARQTGDIGTSQALRRGRIKLFIFRHWTPQIVCPSRESAQELQSLGIPADRLHVIPNGVDTQEFQPASSDEKTTCRARLKLPSNCLVAIYAGRWAPGKGVEELLEIWRKQLAKSNLSSYLMLAITGVPAKISELEKQTLQLDDRVKVILNKTDVRTLYKVSDLAILLSRGEGLSNFLLEAMACGLPTLTSKAAAITPNRDRERWSWVVDEGGSVVDEASNLLLRLQESPSELKTKGMAARQKIEQDYSMDKVASAYEQLYARMLGA